jgi:hypothetical protein
VPTFDNGWICRECWCANKEQDDRCYRCHVVRPEYAAAVEDRVVAAPSEAPPDVPEPMGPPPGVIRRLVGAEPTADARPIGRYCLTCGRKLLPAAAFCTHCGSRSADVEAKVDQQLVADGHEAEPPSEGEAVAPAKRRRPAMPQLDPRAGLDRLRLGYLNFIEKHALRWDLAMAALGLLSFAFATAADRFGGPVGSSLLAAQLALTVIFVLEYATRLAASTDRRSFVIGHPVELVALVPQLRAVRVLALARWLGIPELGRRLSARLMSISARTRRSSRYLLGGLWVILVFLGVAMLFQYTGSSPRGVDRLLAITAGAVVVCLVSAVTSVLTSSVLMQRRDRDDMARRARIIAELKDAGLLAEGTMTVEPASALGSPGTTAHEIPRSSRAVDPARPISGLSPQR